MRGAVGAKRGRSEGGVPLIYNRLAFACGLGAAPQTTFPLGVSIVYQRVTDFHTSHLTVNTGTLP